MPQQDRLNIAVFIDFDNIEIGVKSTLGEHFDVGTILEALKERGEVVTKIAYADWTRAGEYSRALTQHAIRLVQRNLTPGGDKNGADINLALDALEMAFTHQHINAYVIVGGDSDFLSLVEKLKQYDKKVFVVGGRGFTSVILQRNCHEFIAYENLVRRPAAKGGRPAAPAASSPIPQAFPIVRRALKILADREVSPQTGLLKSTLLQLDSTFSERNYGASSFLDFVEKLSQAGLVQLKHAGRSVMVELNSPFDETDESRLASPADPAQEQRQPDTPAPDVRAADERGSNVHAFRPAAEAPVEPLGGNADGVRAAAGLLTAASGARWPMYLRNVKQILRAGGFDERRYAFGGLIDLLRACQKDGLVRMERDRRGGLRVYQGPEFGKGQGTSTPPAAVGYEAATFEPEIDDVGRFQAPRDEPDDDGQPATAGEMLEASQMQAGGAGDNTGTDETDADEVIDAPPLTVVDTTAELLGRAKARRPRARTSRMVGEADTAARGARRTAPAPRKAAAAKRPPRKRTPGKTSGNE